MFRFSLLVLSSFAFAATTPSAQDKEAHPTSSHKHDAKCGHKTVPHGDHTDYIHDGHYHAAHGTHYDDHGTVLSMGTNDREVASADQPIAGHDHKHDAKCGHKAVKHDSHMDYLHDGQFHGAHMDHFDDHGMARASH